MTYSNQSTAKSNDTSEVGNPRAVRISSIVIKAALGIEAAPILANVAVRLKKKININYNMKFVSKKRRYTR
jgi:hypothetical protein